MKSELLRAGKFLCLVGHDNQLSLTNLSLMVVLGRLCFSDAPGLTEVLPFLITVVGYQTKRWQYGKVVPADDTKTIQDAVADLQSKVAALYVGKQFK